MAKRSNHLDWSQKLFVVCFCTGSLVLGAGGAVKASRMMGGAAAIADAPASEAPAAETPAGSSEDADTAAAEPTPKPTPTPETDEDHAAVQAMAQPDKPGEHGEEKDPAHEGVKGDGASPDDQLTESQRRAAYAAIALGKGDEYGSAHGISKGQMDDIAEEGKMKGWSGGGEAKGDVDQEGGAE